MRRPPPRVNRETLLFIRRFGKRETINAANKDAAVPAVWITL